MKRLISWVLSKLFPYKEDLTIDRPNLINDGWVKIKIKEREYFYGGNDRSH